MKTEKITKPGGGYLSVQRAKGSVSVVRFGKTLRDDPSAKYKLVAIDTETGRATDMQEGPVPAKGLLKVELEPLQNYIVIAAGEQTAGLVSTAELNLQAPFALSLDAPAVDWDAVRAQQAQAEKRAEAQQRMRLNPLSLAVKRTLH